MNVKLTLTVPIEEVQEEVNKILLDCERRMKNVVEEIQALHIDNKNMFNQFENIENIRKKINIVDLKLEDSYSILSGYITYKTSKNKQEQENESPNQEGKPSESSTE